MTFLQPMLLVALPLVALPIVIHLINQRRYQTIRWAAMIFLLAANRMSRGYAKLRQWLILLFRTLAIAALVFAVSRPLAGAARLVPRTTAGRSHLPARLPRRRDRQRCRAGDQRPPAAVGRRRGVARLPETDAGGRRRRPAERAGPVRHRGRPLGTHHR